MFADVLSLNDARWRRLLDRARHDAYHLPEYGHVAGRYEGGEPVAFYAEEGEQAILIPMLVRQLPSELAAPADWRDATSPYGYPGPITTSGVTDDFVRASLLALGALARERAIVTAFLRFHPFCTPAARLFSEIGSVVHHGSVVYVDLTKSREKWWAETRLDHQRNIKRLVQLGYSCDMDDWSAYPEFRAVYQATMQRHGASTFYYFSDEYFEELRTMLGDHIHLCTVRGPSGDVAASGLFLLVDGIAEYHLGGTAEPHFPKAPSKLMFDFVRGWAKQVGATILNLGGGIGGATDSLHWFKSGFSPLQADFHTARVVFDADRYDALMNSRRDPRLAEGPAGAFFPEYRRPLNAGVEV
jgi:hypothetical protein